MKKLNYSKILPVKLAELLDVSESAISQAIKKRRLTLSPDGTLDLCHITNRGYVERRTLRRNEPDQAKRSKAEALLRRLEKISPPVDDDGLPAVRTVSEITGDLLSRAKEAELNTIILKEEFARAKVKDAEIDLSRKTENLIPSYILSDAYAHLDIFFTSLCMNLNAVIPLIQTAVLSGDEMKVKRHIRAYIENTAIQTKRDMLAALEREGMKSRFDECGKCRAARLARFIPEKEGE